MHQKTAYLCNKIAYVSDDVFFAFFSRRRQPVGMMHRRRGMAVEQQAPGVVRVVRQVLSTIVIHTAVRIPGVARMAQVSDQWSRFLGREVPGQGVALTVKDNTVSADLYIVVDSGVDIVEVGTAVLEEVASAIEMMVGMQVQEVNVYIQDVA
jgi:uncharacterized alkaline shock family protein YloU